MANTNHAVLSTFVFTSAYKVGNSTEVGTFIIDVDKPQKFVPIELKVANLGDAQFGYSVKARSHYSAFDTCV